MAEHVDFILAVSGSIITILLVVVGFFLKKIVNRLDKISDTILVYGANYINFEKNCDKKHTDLHETIIDHEHRIKTSEENIIKINAQLA